MRGTGSVLPLNLLSNTSVPVRPFLIGPHSSKRPRLTYSLGVATLQKSEAAVSNHNGSTRESQLGREQSTKKVHLNGSDSNGNVLQGQEDVLETNRNWLNTAFPQYLQSEKDDFCQQFDDAVQFEERKKSSLLGPSRSGVVSSENPIWQSIRKEAGEDAGREPLLSSFLYASILSHDTFLDCLAFVLANRLSHPSMLATEYYETFLTVFKENEEIVQAALEDLQAVRERDPSCTSYSNALLFYKGYHAIQVHRIAHHLWHMGLEVSAVSLQSRVSEVFSMDLHPQAKFGKGILMDHGTGIVVGQTAEIGNNVSILQNVTLGGTGKGVGDRHPKISDNVLIGAAATVLGNIRIGKGAMVAAGSLVLKPVPPKTMVAGSPAKEIGKIQGNPALKMQHWLKSLNPANDPFESALRDRSFQAAERDRNAKSDAMAAQDGLDSARYSSSDDESSAVSMDESDLGNAVEFSRHSVSDSKDDSLGVNLHHKLSLNGTSQHAEHSGNSDGFHRTEQGVDKSPSSQDRHVLTQAEEEPVLGVRSDYRAAELWPEPEEPEYYL